MAKLANLLNWLHLPAVPPPALRVAGPLDFGAPAFVQDPYPDFARLRREEPLHRSAGGPWVLSRYADIAAALHDPRLGNAPAPYAVVSARNSSVYPCAEVANNTLPFMDGAAHAGLRQALARCWTAQLHEQPPQIETHARRLLAQCAQRGEFDLLRDFATPLAVTVIAEILGVSDEDRPALHADAQWFFYLFTSMPSHAVREQTDLAVLRLRRCFGRLLEERVGRTGPARDLIGRLSALHAQGFSRDQLSDNLALLWADGIGNVDTGIASAFGVLLQHREQWQLLRVQPELAKGAAAECLRFESPAQFIGRIVQEDFAWHGRTLKCGEAVLLLLASANRDEQQYERPDHFDIRRPSPSTLSFGRGHHSCLGAALARSEIEIALRVAAEMTPQLRLRTDTLEWHARLGHRWLAALPVATR